MGPSVQHNGPLSQLDVQQAAVHYEPGTHCTHTSLFTHVEFKPECSNLMCGNSAHTMSEHAVLHALRLNTLSCMYTYTEHIYMHTLGIMTAEIC